MQTLMKCHLMWHFIRVCTVCQSTCLPVSIMKRVNSRLYNQMQKRAVESDICFRYLKEWLNSHMWPCYPQVCIWTDPIYKNKLAQIANFATSVAYKIIKGFLFLDRDRIKVVFKKNKIIMFFSLSNSADKSCRVNYTPTPTGNWHR